MGLPIKTQNSESQGQGGSGKWCPDGLETHTCKYFTGTRASTASTIKNGINKNP